MDPFWLKKGVKPAKELDHSAVNLLEVADLSLKKFANNIAYSHISHDMTFGELDKKSLAFAAYLQSLPGVNPGDRVALMAPNILSFPVACLGIVRAGLVVVNTNPLYTEREMLHQFHDSGAKVLIIFAAMAQKAQNLLTETSIEHVVITRIADFHPLPKRYFYQAMVKYVAKMEPAFTIQNAITFRQALDLGARCPYHRPDLNRESLAILQYTGGTTGVAKGAMLTHGNLLANLAQSTEAMSTLLKEGQELFIAPLPLYHIYSFTLAIMAMLVTGNRSVLITNPRNMTTFIKTMSKYKFTGITGINTLFVALCEDPRFQRLDFSHLRLTTSGGMSLTPQVAEAWQSLTGCEVMEGYGLTEASPIVSMNLDGHKHLGSIGRPVDGTEIKLVDDQEQDLPLGDPDQRGELWVRGPQVMLGYWQKPEETKLTLTADGWLRTGDIATIDRDGYIRIVDRKKDMIITSGFNVYPNEIEDVMANHPGILECAAIGIPHKKSGEAVKLFVVPRDHNLTESDVLEFSRKHLTGYKVPKIVEFRSDLPKSPVGKILRKELRNEIS